jgi:hypothetical protein
MAFIQKTQMPEEDMKVASREIDGFNAPICFMAQGTAKICQMVQAGKIYNAELLCEEADAIFMLHIQQAN